MSTRDEVRRELQAFGTELADGDVGYVLVVVRDPNGSRQDRGMAVGDTINLREHGLTRGETRVVLERALAFLEKDSCNQVKH